VPGFIGWKRYDLHVSLRDAEIDYHALYEHSLLPTLCLPAGGRVNRSSGPTRALPGRARWPGTLYRTDESP
jgi:hypothetical protein